MSRKSKYSIIIVEIVFIMAIVFKCHLIHENTPVAVGETMPEGTISYGTFSVEGEFIDNGSEITVTDNLVEHIIEISQNLESEREYKLIVFADQKQTPFEVDGVEYSDYSFELNTIDTRRIPVKISLPNVHPNELCYIFIKNPNYKVKEREFGRAHVVQEVLPLKYYLSKQSAMRADMEYSDLASLSDSRPLDEVFVSTNKDELTIPTEIKKGTDLYTVLGNMRNKSVEYGIILLEDWKQINILENESVLYYRLDANQRIFFELPDTLFKSGKNYQVIGFPLMNRTNWDDMDGLNVYASHRFNIIE